MCYKNKNLHLLKYPYVLRGDRSGISKAYINVIIIFLTNDLKTIFSCEIKENITTGIVLWTNRNVFILVSNGNDVTLEAQQVILKQRQESDPKVEITSSIYMFILCSLNTSIYDETFSQKQLMSDKKLKCFFFLLFTFSQRYGCTWNIQFSYSNTRTQIANIKRKI